MTDNGHGFYSYGAYIKYKQLQSSVPGIQA